MVITCSAQVCTVPGGTSVQEVILWCFSNACSSGVAVAFAVEFGAAGAMITSVGTPGVGSTRSGAVATTCTGGGAGTTSAASGSGVTGVREGGMTVVLLSGARADDRGGSAVVLFSAPRGAVELSRVLLSALRGADRAVLLSGKGSVLLSGTRFGGRVAAAGAAVVASGATVAGGLAVGLPAQESK